MTSNFLIINYIYLDIRPINIWITLGEKINLGKITYLLENNLKHDEI